MADGLDMVEPPVAEDLGKLPLEEVLHLGDRHLRRCW
jgi:hypothetical protein